MIPETHAGTRTPAWPGGGGARGLSGTGRAALWPIAIATHGIYVADIDIDIDGARVDRRARNK